MGINQPDGERGGGAEASGIKVTDRRLFNSEGRLRPGSADAVEDTAPPPTRPIEAEAPSAGGERGFEHRPVEEPRGIDFTMLINAMAQPALIFLGEIPHPATGRPEVDLEQARLQIDLLDILRIKCRGNLTTDEQALLDRILYQLRMMYVSRADRPQG